MQPLWLVGCGRAGEGQERRGREGVARAAGGPPWALLQCGGAGHAALHAEPNPVVHTRRRPCTSTSTSTHPPSIPPLAHARPTRQVVNNFDAMGLREDLLRGIYQYGFEKPSAIQQRAILPIVQGRDVIAQAQSGTGKTSLIAVTLLQMIDLNRKE